MKKYLTQIDTASTEKRKNRSPLGPWIARLRACEPGAVQECLRQIAATPVGYAWVLKFCDAAQHRAAHKPTRSSVPWRSMGHRMASRMLAAWLALAEKAYVQGSQAKVFGAAGWQGRGKDSAGLTGRMGVSRSTISRDIARMRGGNVFERIYSPRADAVPHAMKPRPQSDTEHWSYAVYELGELPRWVRLQIEAFYRPARLPGRGALATAPRTDPLPCGGPFLRPSNTS